MSLKNKTILVTGGAGFIGSSLCDELIKEDPKKIIIFDNLCQSNTDNIKQLLEDDRVEFIKGDIRDYEVIEEPVLRSDYIFHLAASNMGTSENRPRVDMGTNIIGSFNLYEAAKKNPEVRIVHVSTGSVLGSSDKPMKEDDQLQPNTPYAISKLAGEQYAKFYCDEHKLKISIIRYFHVFGPRQDCYGRSGVINIFLRRVLNGEPPIIWGTGKQIKCFTFVKDTVRATIMLSQNDDTIGQVYNVASDNRVSIQDLADIIIRKYAKDKTMKPGYAPPKVGENMKPIPDTSKIKDLGFKPVKSANFEEALDKCKQWVETIL